MHHLFAPSSSNRWLECHVSIALERALSLPFEGEGEDEEDDCDQETGGNPFAQEGTTAHALGEWCLQHGKNTSQHPNAITIKGVQQLITTEMRYNVQLYVDYIRSLIQPNTQAMYEKYNVLDWIDSDLGGTGDYIGITGDVLDVGDLKYGQFHAVTAINNTQLMTYALGMIGKSNPLGIKKVRLHIIQPRINPVPSVWETTVDELRLFEQRVKKAIKAARQYLDKGTLPLRQNAYVFGEHCGFCRVIADCKKVGTMYDKESEMEMMKLEKMNEKVLAKRLQRAKVFKRYIVKLEVDAKARLKDGETVPGFALEHCARRDWKSEGAVWSAAKKAGIKVSTLASPKELFEQIGHKRGHEVFGKLVTAKPFIKLIQV